MANKTTKTATAKKAPVPVAKKKIHKAAIKSRSGVVGGAPSPRLALRTKTGRPGGGPPTKRKAAAAPKPTKKAAAPKPPPKGERAGVRGGRKPAAKPARAARRPADDDRPITVLDLVAAQSPRAHARPQVVRPAVRVFQIFYDAQQRPLLDPAFEPYDNRGYLHPLLEFNVFRKLARTPQAKNARLWGALSWKFQQKTGISGMELLRLIDANPGYDVYYCNPHPDTESLYPNLWMQGETSHPNFLLLCTEFFQAAGLPTGVLGEIQPSNAFASTNYFIATPKFWERYLAFVEGAIARAEGRLSPTARKMLYSDAADQRAMHARASYMPHIVERLFSLFLALEGSGFKAYKYAANPRAGAQAHLRLLREMKDVAHRTRSAWLAACWLNYRNLYLASAHDRAWAEKYLKAVTPTQLTFSSFPVAAAAQEAR
ncbi:MAG: hypothetical protein NT123_19150 [Proteobacteria bacterium]|nr:hypothetical protein [Pseudomonadota bacterium]